MSEDSEPKCRDCGTTENEVELTGEGYFCMYCLEHRMAGAGMM